MIDYGDYRCEKCGVRGVTEIGMDIFVASLCQQCFDREWREYLSAIFEREVSEDEAKQRLIEYQS